MPKAKNSKKQYEEEEVEDDGQMPVSDPPAQQDDDADEDFPVVQDSDGSTSDDEDDTAYTLDGTISVAEADRESDLAEERSILEKGRELLKGDDEEEDDAIVFDDDQEDDVAKWASLGDDWENINPYDLDDDGSVDSF